MVTNDDKDAGPLPNETVAAPATEKQPTTLCDENRLEEAEVLGQRLAVMRAYFGIIG